MLFSKCPHNVECAKNRENEGRSFGKCWPWFWAAPSRLSFLTCAAHDLGWEVHRPVCIFLRAVMYRPAYGPPIRGFIFPETSAAQFMFIFEENADVCSIFLYKNRNARSNLCFPSNYVIYIYIILYVIIYCRYCHHIFKKYLHI